MEGFLNLARPCGVLPGFSFSFFFFFFDTPHLEGNKGWTGKGVKFRIERLIIDSAGGLSFTLWTF